MNLLFGKKLSVLDESCINMAATASLTLSVFENNTINCNIKRKKGNTPY